VEEGLSGQNLTSSTFRFSCRPTSLYARQHARCVEVMFLLRSYKGNVAAVRPTTYFDGQTPPKVRAALTMRKRSRGRSMRRQQRILADFRNAKSACLPQAVALAFRKSERQVTSRSYFWTSCSPDVGGWPLWRGNGTPSRPRSLVIHWNGGVGGLAAFFLGRRCCLSPGSCEQGLVLVT